MEEGVGRKGSKKKIRDQLIGASKSLKVANKCLETAGVRILGLKISKKRNGLLDLLDEMSEQIKDTKTRMDEEISKLSDDITSQELSLSDPTKQFF